MRIIFICFLCAISVFSLKAQEVDMDEIRLAFYEATLDSKKSIPLINKINAIKNPPALLLAYKAATEAVMIKTKWSPFAKFSLLKKSRSSFVEAVEKNSKDVEIRFLRFSVQHHIPEFLGYSKNLDEDKDFIVARIEDYKREAIVNNEMVSYIIDFLIASDRCTAEEIEKVKAVMGWVANEEA